MRVLKGNIKNIKTVVLYRWNKFFPEIGLKKYDADVSSLRDKFFKLYSSTEVLYLSEDSNSDFLDFAEYEFKFNPEKDKYGSRVITNLFSKETIEAGKINNKLDYTRINYLNDFMFPQVVSEDTNKEVGLDKYIGMVSNNSSDILFIKTPSEESISDLEYRPGVWKVEFYNDFIESNNSYSYKISGNDEYIPFIEYTVLDKFKGIGLDNTITGIEPGLTLIFGPEETDPKNYEYQDHFYHPGYTYPSASSVSDTNWVDLCREISSGKVISLIISPDKTLESINFSRIGWNLSKNPNRNQNKYSVRKDYFEVTKEGPISDYPEVSKNLVFDSVSGVVLGTKNLGQIDIYGSSINKKAPILESKAKSLRYKYSRFKNYSEGDSVCYNDGLYVSLVSGNIGECPLYSKYWKYIKKYDNTNDIPDKKEYLMNKSNSLHHLNSQLKPDYIYYNLEVSDKSLGSVFPSGKIAVRRDYSGGQEKRVFKATVSLNVDSDLDSDSIIRVYDSDGHEINILTDELYSIKPGINNISHNGEVIKDFNNNIELTITEPDTLKGEFFNRTVVFQLKRIDTGIDLRPISTLYSQDYRPTDIQFRMEKSSDNELVLLDSSGENIGIRIKVIARNKDNEEKIIGLKKITEGSIIFDTNPEISDADLLASNILLRVEEDKTGSRYRLFRVYEVLKNKEIEFSGDLSEDLLLSPAGEIHVKRIGLDLIQKNHEIRVIPAHGFETSSVGSYLLDGDDYSFNLYSNIEDTPWEIWVVPVLNNSEQNPIIISNESLGVEYDYNDLTKIGLYKGLDFYTLSINNIKTSFNVYLKYC